MGRWGGDGEGADLGGYVLCFGKYVVANSIRILRTGARSGINRSPRTRTSREVMAYLHDAH